MDKIILEFSARHSLCLTNGVNVVMTLDETGKNDTVGSLPKRVLKAFTESAINSILSKDEIPNESGMMVLDGHCYEIKITKGGVSKEYDADDASIETYPLLRYLASWYRGHQRPESAIPPCIQ